MAVGGKLKSSHQNGFNYDRFDEREKEFYRIYILSFICNEIWTKVPMSAT